MHHLCTYTTQNHTYTHDMHMLNRPAHICQRRKIKDEVFGPRLDPHRREQRCKGDARRDLVRPCELRLCVTESFQVSEKLAEFDSSKVGCQWGMLFLGNAKCSIKARGMLFSWFKGKESWSFIEKMSGVVSVGYCNKTSVVINLYSSCCSFCFVWLTVLKVASLISRSCWLRC